jgi:hypothetical protein
VEHKLTDSLTANKQKPLLRGLVHDLRQSTLLRGVLLFVAWLAIWQIGRLVEYTDHASVWFPAAGFTFSCLLVLGRRAFLPIMCAAIVTTIWNGNHYQLNLTMEELIWAGFLFGLAHMMPYWLGAMLVGRLANNSHTSVPKLIVTFLLVSGICTLIATMLVLSSLVLTDQMAAAEFSKTILPFWIGDMAGVVVLSPLVQWGTDPPVSPTIGRSQGFFRPGKQFITTPGQQTGLECCVDLSDHAAGSPHRFL